MSSTTWYVRLGDQVLGPISDADLRDRAMQGSVTPQTPVSNDGTTWMEAGTVRGIEFGATSARPSPPLSAPEPVPAQQSAVASPGTTKPADNGLAAAPGLSQADYGRRLDGKYLAALLALAS